MILRSSTLRQGRQVFTASCKASKSASPGLRALSTDRVQPLPTAYAEPTSLPTSDPQAAAPAVSKPDALTSAVAQAVSSPKKSFKRGKTAPVNNRLATQFRRSEAIKDSVGDLGSSVAQRFHPSSLLQDPPRPEDVTLELLMSAQCHMGHHASLWNPANQRYIYGVRSGIHIISLEEIAASLRRAAKVVEQTAYLGGLILFVGNRKGQMEVTARAAELAGACHLFSKWVPGTITNRDQILGKEQLKIVDAKDEAVSGYEKHLLERRPLVPQLVVVLNPLENFTLLHECAQENIPTIGLIDTNGDPTKVTYVIPGNDDSLRSVSVIAGVLGRAGEIGQKRRLADAAKGIVTWYRPHEVSKFMYGELNKAMKLAIEQKEAKGSTESEEQREDTLGQDNSGKDDMSALMEQIRL